MPEMEHRTVWIAALLSALLCSAALVWEAGGADSAPEGRRNVVFVLSDDHRYDFLGFMPSSPAFIGTPNKDPMARAGAPRRCEL